LSENQLINNLFFRALYPEIVTLVKTLRYFMQIAEARIIALKNSFSVTKSGTYTSFKKLTVHLSPIFNAELFERG
tara:strand:- start:129 stop:353 length:225 start_codon:yes stop_codon:yes gene_type:complete